MAVNTEYEESMNDAIHKFNTVILIEELQKLTIDFLKGKMCGTNYHYGPLSKESKKIKNELIKMNELGFITTCSQPGELETNSKQRGYVCGIIHKEKYEEFITNMYDISSDIYIRHTNDYKLIESLNRIGTYPIWYWISEKYNINFTHVIDTSNSFEDFQDTYIYQDLADNYYEIEVIDLVWGRENYIHKNIIRALLVPSC